MVDSAGAGGLAAATTGSINAGIDWHIFEHVRGITDLPIAIKGIQSYEDVILALEYRVDGTVLSNHRGRSQRYRITTASHLPGNQQIRSARTG
jgi:L-lactate dehydrogenase (cytochrome)